MTQARTNVEVGVDLDGRHAYAACLQDGADRGRNHPLPNAADHSTGHKYVLGAAARCVAGHHVQENAEIRTRPVIFPIARDFIRHGTFACARWFGISDAVHQSSRMIKIHL